MVVLEKLFPFVVLGVSLLLFLAPLFYIALVRLKNVEFQKRAVDYLHTLFWAYLAFLFFMDFGPIKLPLTSNNVSDVLGYGMMQFMFIMPVNIFSYIIFLVCDRYVGKDNAVIGTEHAFIQGNRIFLGFIYSGLSIFFAFFVMLFVAAHG